MLETLVYWMQCQARRHLPVIAAAVNFQIYHTQTAYHVHPTAAWSVYQSSIWEALQTPSDYASPFLLLQGFQATVASHPGII